MVLVSLLSVTRPVVLLVSSCDSPSVKRLQQLTKQSHLRSEYPRKPSGHVASSSSRSFVPNASRIRHCRSKSS